MPIVIQGESPNGGSSSATASFTTDADTFLGSTTVDLGATALATVTFTLTSFTGDGETLGNGPGQIQLQLFTSATIAPGGPTFVAPGLNQGDLYDTLFALDAPQHAVGASARLCTASGQWVDENFIPYAGANHPFGTVRVDVAYLAI